jgi:hypothetical protein
VKNLRVFLTPGGGSANRNARCQAPSYLSLLTDSRLGTANLNYKRYNRYRKQRYLRYQRLERGIYAKYVDGRYA